MDEYSFHTSTQEQDNEFLFSNRQYVYIPDQNNATYSNGQVLFDLASLSNSGRFVDFQQAFATVPLVMNLNLTGLTTASAENAFACSLKNGFHQLVNSLSVEITNNQVVNLTNLSNLDINFRLLTTASVSDERNFLPSINFAKDNVESITYQGVSTANGSGLGECNNAIKQSTFSSASGYGNSFFNSNNGRLERMRNTSFDPTNGTQSVYTSTSSLNSSGKNYYKATSTTDCTFYVLATIPLKILHDIFKKIPLTKGMYMRLILNLNTQCQSVISLGGTGTTYTGYTTTALNSVFPCMMSPLATGNGASLAGTSSATLSLGIGKSFQGSTSFSHPTMSTCRIYAPVYDMTPQAEQQYFSVVPTKKIQYNDILSFSTFGIASGGQVSQILTNGVSRPRYLLVIPQMAGSVHGSIASAVSSTFTAGTVTSALGTPMNSPFSSSPATTCPLSAVTNFNVLVSGTNIYQSSYQYGYESFLQEVRGCNSINGGIPLGLSSGLIDQISWENGYRTYFVDLSRRVSQANDDVSRSIQVVFTNSSPVAMDYYYIVAYERELQISTSTGALVI